MNFGELLLLLIAWAGMGSVGFYLLKRKGYFQDEPNDADAWPQGAGMQLASQQSGIYLPALGGGLLLLAALVLPKKERHTPDD